MSAIKAGDLVMVVKAMPCCGYAADVGRIFMVACVDRKLSFCGACNRNLTREITAWTEGPDEDGYTFDMLRKIEPPAQPETIEHGEEVTA